MDAERALVSKIAQTGEIEVAISRGISESHFADDECAAMFTHVIDHVRHYGDPPSMGAIKEKFKKFDFEISTDNIDYLIDRFVTNVKRRMAKEMLLDLGDMSDDYEQGREIDIHFLDAARQLATIVPTTKSARFSDMSKRIAQYEIDKAAGNVWGIRTGIPAFDEKTFGIQPHELLVVAGWQGTGKALALDTPVPTPRGWSTQGHLQVGDEIFDGDGNICEVTAVGVTMLNRPCRMVEIAGGETIVADAEHEWVTRDSRGRVETLETDQIRQSLHRSWANGKTLNHSLSLHGGLNLPDAGLEIDPYVLGVWLGDGHSNGGRITTADAEIVMNIQDAGYEISDHKAEYNFGVLGLQEQLRREHLILDKRIPPKYLRASYNQRLELLQGLMDTDGYIDHRGCCEYTTTKVELAEAAMELICSLGFKPALGTGRATLNGKDCGEKFRIHFRPGPNIPVFRLTRKAERQLEAAARQKSLRRHIYSIESVKSVPVRCIEVSSTDGRYLVGKTMVPTHNSTLMQFMAFNAYLQGKTVLFISLEMENKALLRKFDTMAVDMNYRELKGYELGPEAMDRWIEWSERVEDDSKDIVIVDRIGSRTPNGIFAETVRHKPDLVVVDYISLLDAPNSVGEKSWQKIGHISRELKLNAQTLGVPVIAAAQTNRESVSQGVKLETIAFSSAIGMDADLVVGLQQDEDMKVEKKMEVVLVKNRDGAGARVTMNWDMETMQLGERPPDDAFRKTAKKKNHHTPPPEPEPKVDNGNPFRKKK